MVAVVGEEIVDVVVGHLVDLADEFGAEVVAQQVVDELAALLGFDPHLTELVEVVRLTQNALDHLAPVFITGMGTSRPSRRLRMKRPCGVMSVLPGISGTGGVVGSGPGPGGFRSFAASTTATTGTRWIGDEIGAEEIGDAGVVVEPELVFLRLLMDAGAAPDHLVELDGGFQITEEDDGVKAPMSTPASSRSTVQAMKARSPEPRMGSIMSAPLFTPPMHLKA